MMMIDPTLCRPRVPASQPRQFSRPQATVAMPSHPIPKLVCRWLVGPRVSDCATISPVPVHLSHQPVQRTSTDTVRCSAVFTVGTRDAPKAQQSTVSHRTALRQQAGDGLPAPAPLFCATPAAVQIRLPSTPRLLLCLTRTWHNTAGSVLSNTSTEEASHSGWARGAASPSRPPSRLACDSSRLQAQRPAPPSHQSTPAQVRQRLASARVLPLCRLSTGSRERGREVGEPPARFDSLRVATLQPRALVCASLCCSP